MGGQESKQDGQLWQMFTSSEKENIHKMFVRIVGSQHALSEPFLKKYAPSWFLPKDRLWSAMSDCHVNTGHVRDKKLSEDQFGGFLALALKGTYAEKAEILSLLSGTVGSQVHMGKLYQAVFSIVKSYLELSSSDSANKTWKCETGDEDISRLCLDCLALQSVPEDGGTGPQGGSGGQYQDSYEVEAWVSKSPLFLRMFDRVMYNLFPVIDKDSIASTFQSFLPVITNVDWSSTYTILDIVSISYLNHHIPRQHQATWRLLYSNSIHGDSFSQLTRFMVGKGPTVMIVKDKDGHVFGGYVSESWEIRPNFYGDSTCFLFTLKPRLGVYMATGYNENFVYLNQGQETLPNGLGFGGQLNYFGMWIDYSFNSGHSKAKPKCTTYGSPQLSGSPEFVVDHLEVWAVGPEKKKNDSDDEDDAKTSILDKDSGAKAILELAGRKHHSEGLRELREDEEMTDEMKRKMNTIPKLL